MVDPGSQVTPGKKDAGLPQAMEDDVEGQIATFPPAHHAKQFFCPDTPPLSFDFPV
jgi:hypothetical protein